ncbi:hypothetical protein BZ164_22745 [Pseudomonas veronii]|nr:hypothetical protein BZ164_22745 [Pseudomonas veronii]
MSSDVLSLLVNSSIKAFLETAPLYSWRSFKTPNRSSLHIDAIDSYCEVCDQLRPFHDMRTRGGGAGMRQPVLESGTSSFHFICVTCKKSQRSYYVEQVVDGEIIRLQKFGELPRGNIPRDKVLQKFLKDDRENYEKAVICLNHDYGVAAFAYFRRVVENNIDRLLDLLQRDLQASGGDKENLEAIHALRETTPMSDKIKIANTALPAHLKPDGLNPLGRLYQVLSEGVHSLPEEDCLRKAKATSECLAFLIGELATRQEHRARFKNMINDL